MGDPILRHLVDLLWFSVGVGLFMLGVNAGWRTAPTPVEVLRLSEQALDQVVERAQSGAYVIQGSSGLRVRIEPIEKVPGLSDSAKD